MKRFSERKGFRTPSSELQIKAMNEALRNSLWNVLHVRLWSRENYTWALPPQIPGIEGFSKRLWFHFFKKPIDSQPRDGYGKLKFVREFFFACEWHDVYDFLEFVVRCYPDDSELSKSLNLVLERELAGYRFVGNIVVDITHEQEIEMLEEALRDTQFEGVNAHLKRALELLSDKKSPDYRNSIKESISAVESIAKIIAGNEKAKLSDALTVLEKNRKIHGALKKGFSSLYGYTSDEDGIRHAMLKEPSLSSADAKFFLLSCTSFINYLKSKM